MYDGMDTFIGGYVLLHPGKSQRPITASRIKMDPKPSTISGINFCVVTTRRTKYTKDSTGERLSFDGHGYPVGSVHTGRNTKVELLQTLSTSGDSGGHIKA
jgi:hypothetical protein